jgi:hypothetical protein
MVKYFFNQLFSTFKTFGFFHGIRKIFITSFYKRLTDNLIADHVYAKSSFRYLKRFYKKHINEYNITHPANEITENDFIYWTCWFQGLEAAPPLVKACINSAGKYSEGRRIIVITYDNLETYVSLPGFILEKHRKGCIHTPHFADIIRAYLLYSYGGLWFDATVLFTKSVPDNLLKENIFFFRSPLDEAYCPVSNWFIIASKHGNLLLYKLLCALLEYWNHKNKYIDYFMFHYFLQIIILYDPESADIFNKIPYRSNQNPHYLQLKLLFSEYNEKLWDIIKDISFCHKLTYKTPKDFVNNKYYSFFSFLSEQKI